MSFANASSFLLLGYGAATNLALNNVYCAHTHPSSVILGLAHGSYGVGGIVAPIIGTAIVSSGVLWSRFYFLSVGLRLCCIAFDAFAFWSYTEESEPNLLTALEATASRQTAAEEVVSKLKDLKLALKNKVTIFGALFIFAYQGAEVSISGWVISYLIKYRDGDPAKVGYVTAGFWASRLTCAYEEVTNISIGRDHIRSVRSHTCRTQDWGEELCRYPHARHYSPPALSLADTQSHRKRRCSISPRFASWTRLSLRANNLFATHAPSCPDYRNRFYRRSGQLRWCSGPVHDWYPGPSRWYVGAASRLSWDVCSNVGLLVCIA